MSYAVIGAGFGDEGKGLVTDALVRKVGGHMRRVVVRFNGGAQAGHTVNDGKISHVFGHVGAGTLAGADTYLSSRFIVNTKVLLNETRVLLDKGHYDYRIFIHPKAMLSTVYDVILNQIAEASRGGNRHGSCGLGINETVTRNHEFMSLPIGEDFFGMAHEIRRIRNEWVPKRLAAIQNPIISETQQSILDTDPDVIADLHFAEIQQLLSSRSVFISGALLEEETTVFEGAQGLALDEFLGEFPHVTRSITGLASAVQAAAEVGIRSITPVYVTRCYSTRHGAGPLLNETAPVMVSGRVPVDTTNIENVWQGRLRFAPLNMSLMRDLVKEDLQRGRHVAQVMNVKIETPQLVVTCLDQLDSNPYVQYTSGRPFMVPAEELPMFVLKSLRDWSDSGFELLATSRGPTYNDITFGV